jgi:polar amino acid transport system substrate-binding protein
MLFSLSSLSSAKKKQKIVILFDESYPPYAYKLRSPGLKGNEKAGGIYPAIIRKAFQKEELKGYKLALRAVPWKAGLRKVERGKALGLFPPYFRPIERPFMNPYSTPILDEKIVLMCQKSVAEKMNEKIWPQDFVAEGISISRNRGFSTASFGKEANRLIKEKKLIIIDGGSTKAAFLMMVKKRTHCYFNDGLSIQSEAKNLLINGVYRPGEGHSEFSQIVLIKEGKKQNFLSAETGHIGWSKKFKAKYKMDIISNFDAVIKKMKKSGEIKSIVRKFLK